MAVLLKTDGTVSVLNQKFTNDDVQKLLGGYYEVVRPPSGLALFPHSDDATSVYEVTEKTLMLVNEEGMLKSLPVNATASELMGQPIRGDVLLVLRGEEFS